uniref:Uncharacterized protein n=1 Tax=Anguilla anguilla TaxID=7936 RepID=A0A0E9SWL6_ANGAN
MNPFKRRAVTSSIGLLNYIHRPIKTQQFPFQRGFGN